MSDELLRIFIPAVIALLLIWLIYRIKKSVKILVKNELYDTFPSLKNKISEFEQSLDYLKAKIETLDHRITETENRNKHFAEIVARGKKSLNKKQMGVGVLMVAVLCLLYAYAILNIPQAVAALRFMLGSAAIILTLTGIFIFILRNKGK